MTALLVAGAGVGVRPVSPSSPSLSSQQEISHVESAFSQEWKIILGVLEDHEGHFSGEPNFRGVRVAFYKDSTEWKPFPHDLPAPSSLETITSEYPQEVNWTIAYRGRYLGEVRGRTPRAFAYYSEIGLQTLPDDVGIATVGSRSRNNPGFPAGSVYRPLVAISQHYFKDPEAWKPAPMSAQHVAALRQRFRWRFPVAQNCASPEENVPKPWDYRNEDMKPGKTYSSNEGWTVTSLALAIAAWHCDAKLEDGGPFYDQWYAVGPTGQIEYLGSGLWYVDAGDYDNDGRSEMLFSMSGYNRGGYKLFYDHFKKSATFEFSYH